jgi:hypothetical protein
VPQVPRDGLPLFELAAGVDVDALIDAVRTAVHELRNQPFRCVALANASDALDVLAQKLDVPLPAEWRGLRGGDFVLDDISKDPPGGRGAALVVGAQIGKAIAQLLGKVPMLGMAKIAEDGTPISLPIAMLGIESLHSAHVAVRDGVAVLAVGDDSEKRVVKALSATADPHAPFMAFTWDVAGTLERFPTLWSDPATVATMKNIKRMDMSLELRDHALDFEIDAGWP